MAISEQIARLEATLRGGTAFAFVGRRGTPPQIGIQVGSEQFPPTDPATPEGAWEWVRLAKLKVQPEPGGGWFVHTLDYDPYNIHGPKGASGLADDPIAAVAAAVEALAAAEHGAATEERG